MENLKIRQFARAMHVPLWRVASELGISEPTITRWLRIPLSENRENEIFEIIKILEMEVE